MDLLLNDLSIHGQFHDLDSFHQALERLEEMRTVAKQGFDREVYFNSNFLNTSPVQNFSMQKAVNQLRDKNKCKVIMTWLTKSLLWWDAREQRRHRPDDLLECADKNDTVITDTAVGEAAFRMLDGSTCGIVSIRPSEWEFSPVNVIYRSDNRQSGDRSVSLENFLDPITLASSLQDAEPPVCSWNDLEITARSRFRRLTFAESCFEPLAGFSFAQASAKTLIARLYVLSQLANARDKDGAQSVEGQQIYKNHFMGESAWFSDSSENDKHRFEERLTFPHPERPDHQLFCPYYGKEKHSQLRLHFSWPIQPGQPVYVVYIGPKLTKK